MTIFSIARTLTSIICFYSTAEAELHIFEALSHHTHSFTIISTSTKYAISRRPPHRQRALRPYALVSALLRSHQHSGMEASKMHEGGGRISGCSSCCTELQYTPRLCVAVPMRSLLPRGFGRCRYPTSLADVLEAPPRPQLLDLR